MRRRSYTNGVLTVIAGCLSLIALDRVMGLSTPAAYAQQAFADATQPEASSGGMISAAEQRKTMINELRSIAQRMERLEAAMNRGLTVKVSEMPELKLPKGRE